MAPAEMNPVKNYSPPNQEGQTFLSKSLIIYIKLFPTTFRKSPPPPPVEQEGNKSKRSFLPKTPARRKERGASVPDSVLTTAASLLYHRYSRLKPRRLK